MGTWVLQFLAAIQGGVWEQLAGYTPMAVVASFQHGLFQLDTVLIAAILIVAGLALAAIWIQLGVAVPRRLLRSVAVVIGASLLVAVASLVHVSWDASENRRNSFPEADEEALSRFGARCTSRRISRREDPRRFDLEHRALSKLRRVMPRHAASTYTSSTSLGLYEQAAPGYGEIRYELGGRRAMSRMTTAEGVLETIYELAGVTPAGENEPGVRRSSARHASGGASVRSTSSGRAVVAGPAVFVLRRHA